MCDILVKCYRVVATEKMGQGVQSWIRDEGGVRGVKMPKL